MEVFFTNLWKQYTDRGRKIIQSIYFAEYVCIYNKNIASEKTIVPFRGNRITFQNYTSPDQGYIT